MEMRDNFRNLALEAKKRMKYGYWTKVISNRKSDVDNAISKGKRPESVYSYYRNKVMTDFLRECLPVSDEEVMYSKVCKILDSEESVTNPIGILMDKEYFNNADMESRSRYVLRLSQLYIKMKERYYYEKRN